VERLSQQIEAQEEKITLVREEKENLSSSFEALRQKREALQSERKQQAETLQADEQNVRNLEKDRDQSHRALTQLKSKLQSLEELDAAHEGLADGPKAVLEWAKINDKTSQLRPLTDALTVKSGYESALQSWLETRMDGLVASKEDDSSYLLELLEKIRQDKQGRVSIQLLAQNQRSHQPDLSFTELKSKLEERGFQILGELTEFVQPGETADEIEQTSLTRLLGSVCVVESAAPLQEFLRTPHSTS
jgi:chromosome segregation ATPase